MCRLTPSIFSTFVMAALVGVTGCSSLTESTHPTKLADADQVAAPAEPPRITLDSQTTASNVLPMLPRGAIVDRLSMKGPDGRIDYVAVAGANLGGIVFANDRYVGALSREAADAFLACRGYQSARGASWLVERDAWASSLLRAAGLGPAELVWNRSGHDLKASYAEVREQVTALEGFRSIVEVGSSPSGIARGVEALGKQANEMAQRERRAKFLADFTPGEKESALVAALGVDIVRFIPNGVLLTYPKLGIAATVRDGAVDALSVGPTVRVTPESAAATYRPGMHWEQCSPMAWTGAAAR